MSEGLQTYLADHLAGAVHAIELVKNLQGKYGQEPVGQLAGELLREIEADKRVLEELAQRVGGGASAVKDAVSWTGEKLSRLKLRHGEEESLGTFESLEHLGLGIYGKLSLWRALAVVSGRDNRLQGPDYENLMHRAEAQRDLVERKRLELAPKVLRFE